MFLNSFSLLLSKQLVPRSCLSLNSLGCSTKLSFSDTPRPYDAIPKVRGYPVMHTLPDYIRSGFGNFHKLQVERLKKYGPIYRETFSNGERVYLSNPEDIEKVFSDETSKTFQDRLTKFWSLRTYASKYNLPNPLLVTDEHEFKKRKKAIKKGLLIPKQVAKLTGMFDTATKDLMKKIDYVKEKPGEVENIEYLLKLWTFECAGITLFHTRLGTLESNSIHNLTVKKFFEGHNGFLKRWWKLEGLLRPIYENIPSKAWYDFENASNLTYEATKELVTKHGQHIVDENSDLTETEILTTCVDVIRAALDTTSVAALWSLIEFARNPNIQERVYEEIQREVPDGIIDSKILQKLIYVRSCLKESLRLHPIVVQLARRLNKDLILSGYLVPAKTLTVLQTANTHVTHPVGQESHFQPERWIKHWECPRANRPPSFYSVPFGHGSRACIGRRVAEIELYILFVNVISNYRIKTLSNEPFDSHYDLLIKPHGQVKLLFEKR